MLKILGLIGPVLRLVSGTIKPATDMIAKVPAFVDDLAGRATSLDEQIKTPENPLRESSGLSLAGSVGT